MANTQEAQEAQEIYPNNITLWPKHMFTRTTKNICEAITRNNLWTWVRNYTPPENEGFMFCNHSNLKLIENDDAVYADGHSGSSWACSMRGAACIAKVGWVVYCQKMKKEQKKELD